MRAEGWRSEIDEIRDGVILEGSVLESLLLLMCFITCTDERKSPHFTFVGGLKLIADLRTGKLQQDLDRLQRWCVNCVCFRLLTS